MTDSPRVELVWIQKSIVKSLVPKLVTVDPKSTEPPPPSNLNPAFTSPFPKVAPFWILPFRPSWISTAVLSAGHQFTSPSGAAVQVGLHFPKLRAAKID